MITRFSNPSTTLSFAKERGRVWLVALATQALLFAGGCAMEVKDDEGTGAATTEQVAESETLPVEPSPDESVKPVNVAKYAFARKNADSSESTKEPDPPPWLPITRLGRTGGTGTGTTPEGENGTGGGKK